MTSVLLLSAACSLILLGGAVPSRASEGFSPTPWPPMTSTSPPPSPSVSPQPTPAPTAVPTLAPGEGTLAISGGGTMTHPEIGNTGDAVAVTVFMDVSGLARGWFVTQSHEADSRRFVRAEVLCVLIVGDRAWIVGDPVGVPDDIAFVLVVDDMGRGNDVVDVDHAVLSESVKRCDPIVLSELEPGVPLTGDIEVRR